MDYLTKADLETLSKYKYHAVASTKLDDILNQYWWIPVSNFIPKNFHPNVLTLVALVCSFVGGFLPFLILSPDFASYCPTWVYITSAAGYFLYQTLDAVDGKQARNTGTSSPIGQLLDHGCDSLTTHFSMFVVAAIIRLGAGKMLAPLVFIMSIQLYMYSWYECTYGLFRCCTGDYLGVTEGQVLIIVINLITAIFPSIWTLSIASVLRNTLGPFGSTLAGIVGEKMTVNVVAYVCCLVPQYVARIYRLLYKDIQEIVYTNPPPDKIKAAKEWLSISLHLYCYMALILGGVLKRNPFCTCILISSAGSLVAWRMILSSVAKAKLRVLQWPSVPFIIVSILCGAGMFTPSVESHIVQIAMVYSTAALIQFVVVHMKMIGAHLGKPLLKIPKKTITVST